MQEEWRPIPGYPDYEVSDQGRVRSYKNQRGFGKGDRLTEPRIMKEQTHYLGYKYVMLMKDGKQHKGYIHHLMGMAFLPNPDNKPEINHIDGNKGRNRLDNFSWSTRTENMEHARRTGLWKYEDSLGKAIESWKRKVYCYETDEFFDSVDAAAKYFGVTLGCITLCCQGKSHHVKGCHLSYAEDADYLRRNIDSIKARQGQKRRVKAINVQTGEERIYPSRKAASRELSIPDSYISNIIAGRSYQTRGWTFEDLPVILESR